uniref:Myo-inositol-1-phosphate synthase GAPDH-like domain-containing protein n=1 Tax=Candidatus Methanophaga sp. ANME-1 ERB7 TaxID=2759913 RepID=A0A7G9Z9B5_9EURY|nr:hypothetical protein IPLBMFHP_00035 [Methanosarcinales archaeon ANME-1 ERB7]
MPKVGVWIIGVHGSVAAASIAGAKIIARGLVTPTGLITELPELLDVEFLPFDQMVFGGHDVGKRTVRESFTNLSNEAHIDYKFAEGISDELDTVEGDVRRGITLGCGKVISEVADMPLDLDSIPLVDATKKLVDDIIAFKKKHNLRSIVVVNLSSTEPPPLIGTHTETLDGFEKALQSDRKDLLCASMLYAYAAFKSGCPFINFTPSAGASIPALIELAKKQQVPYVGNDGKTGETLIKSVLALLFKYRAMKVLSWQGYNILGNMDGKVLDEPATKLSKKITKDSVLSQILGYGPHTHVGIDYVPSLGEWKIAWDFIHFEGFLGTRMNLQFTWNGCDSILAAPLVLDLVRLVELAHRRGEKGILPHLALFFKHQLGTDVSDLAGQWDLLLDYLKKAKEERI